MTDATRNASIEHNNGLTTNIDTHEANLKYCPVLHIILKLSYLLG